ncbi:hypothetical protein FRB90_003721, partial [Tulasnella sp. 427]
DPEFAFASGLAHYTYSLTSLLLISYWIHPNPHCLFRRVHPPPSPPPPLIIRRRAFQLPRQTQQPAQQSASSSQSPFTVQSHLSNNVNISNVFMNNNHQSASFTPVVSPLDIALAVSPALHAAHLSMNQGPFSPFNPYSPLVAASPSVAFSNLSLRTPHRTIPAALPPTPKLTGASPKISTPSHAFATPDLPSAPLPGPSSTNPKNLSSLRSNYKKMRRESNANRKTEMLPPSEIPAPSPGQTMVPMMMEEWVDFGFGLFSDEVGNGDLTPLNAPTQKRNYAIPSATSRKEFPPSVTKALLTTPSPRGSKRSSDAADLPSRDDVEQEERGGTSPSSGSESPSSKEHLLAGIEAKRRANTIAARKSRQRKLEFLNTLQLDVQALQTENSELRERLATAEQRAQVAEQRAENAERELLHIRGLTPASF